MGVLNVKGVCGTVMICLTVLWEVSCYRELYVSVCIMLCGGDFCAVTDLELQLLSYLCIVSCTSCMHVHLEILLLGDVDAFLKVWGFLFY